MVERLLQPAFLPLWQMDVGSAREDVELVPLIFASIDAVREAYRPFGEATDTLVTKVLLGTLACLPACDRFFIDGFKSAGFKYSYLNAKFARRMIEFCCTNLNDLRKEQARIKSLSGVRYPLMKLVDMYFWQIGYERSPESGAIPALGRHR